MRRYDAIDRFEVLAEQLEIAYELLEGETLAKGRTALVTLDSVAHVLLHQHALATFAAGETSRWHQHRRYTKSERRKTLGDFNRTVNLAIKVSDAPWRPKEPILDEPDAVVFRVAHTCRNNIYHEDRHNPALLPLLAIFYAQAVGRAFVRSYRAGDGESIESGRAHQIAALGYEPPVDSLMPSIRMFTFRDAAAAVTDRLAARFTIDHKGLRSWLADDIVDRAERCGHLIAGLLGSGMSNERLERVFFWSQFWAEHGADPQWLELEDARDALSTQLPARGDTDLTEGDHSLIAEHERVSQAYIERSHELQKAFTPPVATGDRPDWRRVARRCARRGIHRPCWPATNNSISTLNDLRGRSPRRSQRSTSLLRERSTA